LNSFTEHWQPNKKNTSRRRLFEVWNKHTRHLSENERARVDFKAPQWAVWRKGEAAGAAERRVLVGEGAKRKSLCVCFGMFLVCSKSLVMADLMGGRGWLNCRKRKHTSMLLYKLQSILASFLPSSILHKQRAGAEAEAPFLGLKMLYDSLSVRGGANLCKVQMKLHRSPCENGPPKYTAPRQAMSAWIRLYLFAHSHCSAISF
jgi:hypothetical protein